MYDTPTLLALKASVIGVMCRSLREEPKTNSLVSVGLMIVVTLVTNDHPGAPKLIGPNGML